MFIIGIDIGGMSVKVGLVNEKGKILFKNKIKTAQNPFEIVEGIVCQINEVFDKKSISIKDIKGIGIGCPGLIDSKNGIIVSTCNIPFDNFPIVSELKKYFDTNIRLSNDANVAAFGEAIYGAAKGFNDVVMITLGTGVGGGIVVDKKLFEGGLSMGAELGHTTLVSGGIKCNCGRKGCFECYASATALIRQTKEAMLDDKTSLLWDYSANDINNVNGLIPFECAKKGDKTAQMVVDNYIYYLSQGIISLLNIFRPQAFVIGGGISGQGDYLIDKVIEHCKKENFGYKNAPTTKIMCATLGNDAGIIGAAALIN